MNWSSGRISGIPPPARTSGLRRGPHTVHAYISRDAARHQHRDTGQARDGNPMGVASSVLVVQLDHFFKEKRHPMKLPSMMTHSPLTSGCGWGGEDLKSRALRHRNHRDRTGVRRSKTPGPRSTRCSGPSRRLLQP